MLKALQFSLGLWVSTFVVAPLTNGKTTSRVAYWTTGRSKCLMVGTGSKHRLGRAAICNMWWASSGAVIVLPSITCLALDSAGLDSSWGIYFFYCCLKSWLMRNAGFERFKGKGLWWWSWLVSMFFLFPKWEAGMCTIGNRLFCGHNIICYIPCILKWKKNSCQNSIHHWIPVNTTHLDVILISDHCLASEFSSVIWERAARIGPKGCMWTLGHPLSVTALYRNKTKPIICTVQISVLGKKTGCRIARFE